MNITINPSHKDYTLYPMELLKQPGTILLCDHSIPDIDACLIKENKKKQIDLQILDKYLHILEIIVTYDRIVVGRLPYETYISNTGNNLTELCKAAEGYFAKSGHAEIEENFYKVFFNSGISINPLLEPIDGMKTPDQYIRELCIINDDFESNVFNDSESWVEREKIMIWNALHQGTPMALTEYSRRAGIPSFIPRKSHNYDITPLLSINEEINNRVMDKLLSSASKGVKKEIQFVQNFCKDIILPPTPIASLIVNEAKDANDLVSSAFRLRDIYSQFRVVSQQIEERIFDNNISNLERLKAVREMEYICSALNPSSENDLKKGIASSSSFFDNLGKEFSEESEFSIKRITDIVLSKPVEYLISSLKKRKFRILFEARRSYMKSKPYQIRIAELFGENPANIDFVSNSCPICSESI